MPTKRRPNRARRFPLPAALPGFHALLAPATAYAFDVLRVGASLVDERQWHALHVPEIIVTAFELAHGRESERGTYNQRLLKKARTTREAQLGTHAGFSDFFVPITVGDEVVAVFVSGPFSTARATSDDILRRWRSLSGREGHLSDPEFSQYVTRTLDTLVLEGKSLSEYQRLLECFALLCASQGDAHQIAAEASALRGKLEKLRFPNWVWASAQSMIDENTTRTWLSPHRAYELGDMGLSKPPTQVLVCLTLGRSDEPDPVGELVRRDAFQRACVELSMAQGETVVGRVGEQGVVFLVGAQASRARAALADLSVRVTKLARQYGFSLRSGMNATQGKASLSSRFEQALGAAEGALLRGESLATAEHGFERAAWQIPRLRRMLSEGVSPEPRALATRFERYAQAVVLRSGYKLDLARAHLEAGFDQVARSLLPSDALEQKSFIDPRKKLDREARDAATVSELFAVYRRAIVELIAAIEHPVEASRDRGLQRALSFAERHLAEPITLTQIARVAGFSRNYFCKLIKQREHVTFEQYLRTLRIERAKQLLIGTDLPIERVAAQSTGFPLRHYFHRMFKREVGTTPLVYRNSAT